METFFFGGEITFTRGKKEFKKQAVLSNDETEMKNFNETFSSYIVKSNLFPQQTSLLGMLRYLILSNNPELFSVSENKIKQGKQADVEKEIGMTSFQLNNKDFKKMDFKKIHSISPCFLQRQTDSDWKNLFCSSFDYSLHKVYFEKGKSLLNGLRQYAPIIEEYKAKDGLTTYYLGDEYPLKESDLFVEDPRIGIDKDYTGKTKDNAFYKQIFYRFADKFEKEENQFSDQKLRFAFYADLDYNFNKEKFIISLGGDNSLFVLQATNVENAVQEEELTKDFENALPNNYFNKQNFDCYGKVVLLSDAYLEKQDVEKCIFSINDTISFRFLTSTVSGTKNYYKFSGQNKLQRSNEKINLYQNGSVFYFENEENLKEFEDALKAKECFYQIGYNYFKTIKK